MNEGIQRECKKTSLDICIASEWERATIKGNEKRTLFNEICSLIITHGAKTTDKRTLQCTECAVDVL